MTIPFQPKEKERLEKALRRFDEENARDPNLQLADGILQPRELVYARRLTAWVLKLAPEASEELRLAARCQHLCRWMIPRASYPMTRNGYLQWREALKRFHAERAGEILRELGHDAATVSRVHALNLKKNDPEDPEACALEDALCLVFLEHQLAELASKASEETMVNALRKTWKKMTPRARAEAARLAYGEREKELLNRASLG